MASGCRVGLISDAHGNPEGLELCLRYLREVAVVDRLWFLGDAVGYLPAGGEVVAMLRTAGAGCILGNHDAMVLGSLPLDAKRDEVCRVSAARKGLSAEDVETLRGWRTEAKLAVDGRVLLLVHGSPWERLTGYVHPDAALDRFAELGFDAVVMGHTHRPFVRRVGGTLVLNPGSCGLPRDHGALASCAVYDSETHTAQIVRLRMDVAGICKRLGNSVHPSVRECLMRLPESEIVGQIVE